MDLPLTLATVPNEVPAAPAPLPSAQDGRIQILDRGTEEGRGTFRRCPAGSDPTSLIVGAGKPVAAIANVPNAFIGRVALDGVDDNDGVELTASVSDSFAAVPNPFAAVNEKV